METNIRYEYNPQSNNLIVFVNDKPVGGFRGEIANRKFSELIEAGNSNISIGVTNMKSTKIRRLRALWIQQGIDDYRDAILEPYEVTSTADLNEQQLDELIRRFSYDRHQDVPGEIRKERSVALKLLTEMGIYDNKGQWERVNNFLMDKRVAGKLMYEMDLNELKALSIKLRSIKQKWSRTNEILKGLTNLN